MKGDLILLWFIDKLEIRHVGGHFEMDEYNWRDIGVCVANF